MNGLGARGAEPRGRVGVDSVRASSYQKLVLTAKFAHELGDTAWRYGMHPRILEGKALRNVSQLRSEVLRDDGDAPLSFCENRGLAEKLCVGNWSAIELCSNQAKPW
jgi:hypothetical protein